MDETLGSVGGSSFPNGFRMCLPDLCLPEPVRGRPDVYQVSVHRNSGKVLHLDPLGRLDPPGLDPSHGPAFPTQYARQRVYYHWYRLSLVLFDRQSGAPWHGSRDQVVQQ